MCNSSKHIGYTEILKKGVFDLHFFIHKFVMKSEKNINFQSLSVASSSKNLNSSLLTLCINDPGFDVCAFGYQHASTILSTGSPVFFLHIKLGLLN